jgi:hypothetical protein
VPIANSSLLRKAFTVCQNWLSWLVQSKVSWQQLSPQHPPVFGIESPYEPRGDCAGYWLTPFFRVLTLCLREFAKKIRSQTIYQRAFSVIAVLQVLVDQFFVLINSTFELVRCSQVLPGLFIMAFLPCLLFFLVRFTGN